MCRIFYQLVMIVALLSSAAMASPFKLQYGGRLTTATGEPAKGPVNLSLRFYDGAGTNAVAVAAKSFPDVPLTDGIFSVLVSLTDQDFNTVFAMSEVWIEVVDVSNNTTYPRQQFTAVPFAFRIPVDGATLNYDGSGRLQVLGLAGSALPSGAPSNNQTLKWIDGRGWVWANYPSGAGTGTVYSITAGNGLTGGTITDSGTIALSTSGVTPGTYSRASVTVDTFGRVTSATNGTQLSDTDISSTAAISQSKIANLTTDLAGKESLVTAGTSAQYYRGDKSWQTLNTTAVSEGTNLYYTDARARAALSGTAPVTYTAATGAISMAQASSIGSGYLTSSDWLTFNNKQNTLPAASATASGYLTSTDWVSFNSKEPALTAGTGSQYYRGDKSWQTLNTTAVTEGSNLYYTDTRSRAALSGTGPVTYNTATGAISMSQATSVANGYLTSADWLTFNAKQPAITATTAVTFGSLSSALQSGMELKPYGTAAGQSGELRFTELAAGGTDYVGFKAPDSISASKIWVLPSADGTNGQALITNGTGTLSWATLNTGTVSSVSGTAPISIATGSTTPVVSIAQATGSTGGYLSAADWTTFNNKQNTLAAASASVNGYLTSTDWTTFNNKQATLLPASTSASGYLTATDWTTFNAKEPTVTAGTTTQYYRGDKSWQTLNTSVVTEGANLYYSDVRARAAISASAPLSYSSSTGALSLPAATGSQHGYLTSSDWTAFNNKVSSQWSTSGTNISYSSGNVGIGTTTPDTLLTLGISTSAAGLYPSNAGISLRASNSTTTKKTGLYLSNADDLSIYTLDNLGIHQKWNGNVGIGTTTPGSTLEVNGNITMSQGANRTISVATTTTNVAGNNLTIQGGTAQQSGPSAANGGALYLTGGTGYGSSGANSGGNVYAYGGSGTGSGALNGNVILAHNGTSAVGNVGIGTTNPNAPLNVALSNTAAYSTSSLTTHPTTSDALSLVNTSDYSNSDFVGLLLQNRSISVASARIAVTGGITSSALAFLLRPTSGTATTTEFMRINSDGYVGIGTTAPTSTLQVYGAGTGTAPATSGSSDSTTNGRFCRGSICTDLGIIDNGNSYIQSRIVNNFANNYPLLLNPNGGNVGIGTTAPTATLHVNGTMAATNLPQLTSLGVAMGTVTCNDAYQAQTSLNFTGNAGQKVDIRVSSNLRLNTSGYHYLDLFLDGTLIDTGGVVTNSSWRSQVLTTYAGVLSTSGNHTLQAKITCGQSATSGRDTGGEWPNGGLHYQVWVGG